MASGSAAPVTLAAFLFFVLAGCAGILVYGRAKDRDGIDFEDDVVDDDLEEFLTQVEFDDDREPVNGNGGRTAEDAPQPTR